MSSDLDNRSTLEDFGLTSLPAEWRVPVVGDLLGEDRGISVGVMYPGEHCDQGVPLVKAGDLKSNWINPTPPFRITPDKHYEYRRTELEGGELLVSLVGNTGQTAVVPPHMKGWNVARAVAVVRLGRDADPHYVKYALQLPAIGHLMKSWCNTTVQETLNLKEIKRIPIPVPEKTEQKAIAHILGTLDDKIELNRKTNETLEAMAKALFQSWFVDFDPVRAKAEGRPTGLPDEISELFPDSFKDSDLGEIPRGWEPRSIREWGKTECGKTPSTRNQEFYGNDYMFVTIPDLHNGLHVVSSGKQLSKLGADSQRKKMLPPGSVMVSCIATPGLVGVAKEACFTNQQINSIIPNNKEASWLLALAMIENRDLLLSLGGGGSVFFNLSKGRFDEIEILAPSEDLISAFSGVASALMDKCFATRQATITLAKTRDTLLPKLISGELRIPEAEKLLEQAGV